MARILIVGEGSRCVRLAGSIGSEGHLLRVVVRAQSAREAIECVGAECRVDDLSRLGGMIGALDGVAIVCWLLGSIGGEQQEQADLHGSRLRAFLQRTIDSTVRGVVYEAAGTAPKPILSAGLQVAREVTGANSIPLRVIEQDPADLDSWLAEAHRLVVDLIAGVRGPR